MNIWKRIRQLSVGQLWKLTMLFVVNPFKIIPTLRATQRTFYICNKLYGKEHHKSNKANAFRHALWNALICKSIRKKSKNKQKTVFWAQKVTDLYENVTKNNELDEAMDLHNNAIGRISFLNFLDKKEEELVGFLQNKSKNARKIKNLEEIESTTNQMVYLHD